MRDQRRVDRQNGWGVLAPLRLTLELTKTEAAFACPVKVSERGLQNCLPCLYQICYSRWHSSTRAGTARNKGAMGS